MRQLALLWHHLAVGSQCDSVASKARLARSLDLEFSSASTRHALSKSRIGLGCVGILADECYSVFSTCRESVTSAIAGAGGASQSSWGAEECSSLPGCHKLTTAIPGAASFAVVTFVSPFREFAYERQN
jgi:hypothetical protein